MMGLELTPLEKMKEGLSNWRGKGNFVVIRDEERGRCVLTTKAIEKHEFVLEYEGDLVTKPEGTLREVIYGEEGVGCHMIWWKKADQVLDGTLHFGTLGRLVNHAAKSPNLEPFRLLPVERGKPKRLALRAARDIQEGEELMWDYGFTDEQKKQEAWRDYTCPRVPHPLYKTEG